MEEKLKSIVIRCFEPNPVNASIRLKDGVDGHAVSRELRAEVAKISGLKAEVSEVGPPIVWVFVAFGILSKEEIVEACIKHHSQGHEFFVLPKGEGAFLEALSRVRECISGKLSPLNVEPILSSWIKE